MGVHKLTAGDGYAYLTRQVAAHDATELGAPGQSLAAYYEQRGESPGRWFGAGLAGLDMSVGGEVTAAQMSELFGQGRHPNAEVIEAAVLASGGDVHAARRASALGRAFAVYSAASPFRVEVARRFSEHNLAASQRWNEPIPGEVRARIRTEVGRDMFASAFGRAPTDARELSGFVAVASRQPTKAVAGFDLTFSPVKSVSALWAVAPPAVVEQIEAAHQAAVADTIAWIEIHAAYTRTGKAGVRQVDTRGLIAAAFTHRDSRAGDPDLHTHVAVSNKVQAVDGRWLALDGRILFKANVAASERYNTRLEAELVDRLGVQFAPRPEQDRSASRHASSDAGGRRVVREIVGVDERLIQFWSQRRAVVDRRRAVLAATFQTEHGRPPTEVEAIALAQQANLETRAAKHEPRRLGDQRATWHTQACDVLGNPEAVTRMLRQVARQSRTPSSTASPPSRRWIEQTARSVVAVVANDRATWQVWHVRAEAERHARAAQLPREVVDDAVGWIVATALGPGLSIRLGVEDPIVEPDVAGLRRADGSSVYQVAGATSYTSQAVLDAEQFLLGAAQRGGGRVVSADDVLVAVAESAAHGLDLNPTQAQLVQELATSGARLQVAIAPAGSGKTTAMRVLARAWTTETHRRDIKGRATVLGLAPSAAAAAELRSQIGGHCDTLAKLVHAVAHPSSVPAWVQRIDDQTLVIVDEAAMAGTADLATVVSHVLSRGASVRLIGDDHQLASVSAGGILRDIADQVGVVTLSELRRFSDRAEAAATLALRAGDPAALGFYLDHARVHVGDLATAADMAYQAWAADRAAGRDAILLAPTRELAAQLNARARADRSASDHQSDRGSTSVRLADGNHAGLGDLVITRRNNRMLSTSATDWVKNGDRWTITAINPAGDLTVRHRDTQRSTTLPSHYVADHVDLGYATTIHTAQGVTADIAHTVATGTETRQLFYVAMTRGRHANHVYLATVSDGEEHNIIRPETVFPPTATDILTAILARDERQQSATSYANAAADPGTQLHQAVLRYHDAVDVAAEHVLGPDVLAQLDRSAELLHRGLTGYPAYPTLRAHLSLLAVDTATPAHRLLRDAYTARELDTALDPAAVLDWRLPHPTGTGTGNAAATDVETSNGRLVEPLPWLPAIPAALHQHPQWGDYLSLRAARVAALADQVKSRAADWTALSAPAWARHLLDPADTDLRQELAVWRASYAVPDNDRHPTGPVQLAVAARGHQSTLDRRAALVLGDPTTAGHPWSDLARRIEPRILDDPLWPQIAGHLDAAHRTGIPVERLLVVAAGERPLPDDQPAAALWWRIAGHLSPAAVTGTERSGAAKLRPDWTPHLVDSLGPARAAEVMSSPAWPALVAAVHSSTHDHRGTGWTSAALIATALDLALAAETSQRVSNLAGERTQTAGPDLADALVWHVAMLTDPAPVEDEPPADDYAPTTDRPEATTLPQQQASPAAAPSAMRLPRDAGDAGDTVDAAEWAAQLEEHKWATAEVAHQRLLDLNQQALAFYTSRFSASWAAPYLRERLGIDLTSGGRDTDAIARYGIGYAPSGWTALTDHLRATGASERELVVAGLARTTRTGRIIDTFRDRMIFPIYHDGDLVGFIGRRNPDRDPDDHRAGPKYLNTAQTDLYDKGSQLFGLSESAAALDDGATPVLVEGPLDAIAITLAGKGNYVGLAPLGTALTENQTDQLRPYLPNGVVVATDADAAGQRAAQRAYWRLVAHRTNPAQLLLPAGQDPADVLRTSGADDLHDRLIHPRPLAHALIDSLATDPKPADAVQRAAQTIAALPPEQWDATIRYAADSLNTPVTTLQRWVIDHAEQWTRDPQSAAEQALRSIGSALTRRVPPSGGSSVSENRLRRPRVGVPALPVLPPMQRRTADSPARDGSSGVDRSR